MKPSQNIMASGGSIARRGGHNKENKSHSGVYMKPLKANQL